MQLVFLVSQVPVLYYGYAAAKFDLQHFKIPNALTLKILIVAVVCEFLYFRPNQLVTAGSIVFIHFAISLVSPKSFGMGDVKFIAGLALLCLDETWVFTWLGLTYIFGSIHGIWRKIRWKSPRIPFGVSIFAAWTLIYMGEWVSVALDYSR